MSATAYSDLKAAWHVDKIAAMKRGEQVVPAQVQLIISDLCNHDCHFCAYRMSGGFSSEQFADEHGNKNPNRRIPTEKCIEIIDDCAVLGVGAMQFTGGGEPTVHPDHLYIFGHAQARGLETSLVTNGCILRENWQAVLPKMKWIRVSVDAGSAEEYARVRRVRPGLFRRALGNVNEIAKEIKAQGTDCLLGCGYVVTRENWRDLYEGVHLIRETGAAYVRLSAMFSEQGAGYYDGIYDNIRECIKDCKTLETDTFKVVDLFGDRISDLQQHSPDYSYCGYQQFNCFVGGNLKIYRCCTTAYTRHGEIGDLRDQSFAQWFYSKEKQDKISNFNARSCHTCQFNNKNRVINYLTQPAPLHVQFV